MRDSHQIDGQVRDVNEYFDTNMGSKLLHPLDRGTGAPAGDIINCRCDMIAVI